MKVGLIGCGGVGKKRAGYLIKDHTLLRAVDTVLGRAEEIAHMGIGITAGTDYNDIVNDDNIELVIVSTVNNKLAPYTLQAVEAGKHVLVEKPGAISSTEFDYIISAAKKNDVFVRVGYNHRYHPAIQRAFQMVSKGEIGDLMYIRGHYGHGGRIGYNKEWRADPSISGGGELIDQGVHLIDLSQWLLGTLTVKHGSIHNYYWDMPVEDNAFMVLENKNHNTAFLQVSCTEWKNSFSYDIYGKTGKLQVIGLGGSYGTERLLHYKMKPGMGKPDCTEWKYNSTDISWENEMGSFIWSIDLYKRRLTKSLGGHGSMEQAKKTLQIVEEIYRRCKHED